ncbi:MAG: SUMF1/EgtB/PvdO family nonheme iron enzyme [Saprospiraceae bacterium]|nr:SUMF1/EgtB/PvdO family nonheme iron enzyme [Saprospiraceae bacterium]MCF8249850.1 SUMF1/EgtB/PvdO family nonheme iron enzyme [Saprospiraceae bacterium]MCF8279480.1 SUMF1/EgtB/PvdO family nonheme iron enzyme [Bacteroidales bacterium]MCF8311716.1 SUMF1/EgtB/PvdO family nonheme iron enzyme [Saprospiraceae bacterium]MCF8440283.1 SUMF1/EgtB/PvdO family nonheme iron enzyme [Saprospiraceae bacterium]
MPILPKIFIAYAREDAHLLEKLRKPLNVLRRNGHCDIFFDGEIVPGERWDKRLKDELHQADIYILLVTDDFLDSDYINDVELPKALDKEKEGKAKVVPIILRPCMWQYTLLKEFQVVLYEGKPIEPSGGYVHAVEQVARVIEGRNETLRLEREASERRLEEARQKAKADLIQNQTVKFVPDPEKLKAVMSKFEKFKRKDQQQKRDDGQLFIHSLNPFHDLMLPIKGGTFKMGDEHGELKANCRLIHEVTIKDFQFCKHPVTQVQWRAVMGSDPQKLHFKDCDDCPVESVSWNDVQEFIEKLNEKTGEKYRLPTEAEWEFAARGGNQSKKYKFSGSNKLDEVAWHSGNSGSKTQPVVERKANELGLYDLTGNVWEWCQDTWHDSYQGAPTNGSAWNFSGDQNYRVVRGGSWHDDSRYCRIASRSRYITGDRDSGIGFRLAR